MPTWLFLLATSKAGPERMNDSALQLGIEGYVFYNASSFGSMITRFYFFFIIYDLQMIPNQLEWFWLRALDFLSMSCWSDSSIPSANLHLDFLVTSITNTEAPTTRPTTRIIIMIPNCVRLRGWLCLILGCGIGMGGIVISSFTLLRIPVSFNHIIESLRLSLMNLMQSI